MISYNRAMALYDTNKSEPSITYSKGIDEAVASMCSTTITGQIVHAVLAGESKISCPVRCKGFNDSDYCNFFKQATEKYLNDNGYKRVKVYFKLSELDYKNVCWINIYL